MVVNAVAPWEGQLVWVGIPNGGTASNGKEWKSVDFTLKYTDSRLQEKYITFNAFGADRVDKLLSTPIGTSLQVIWAPDTRESTMQDGSKKWWPSYAVFSIKVLNQQAQHPAQPVYQQPAYQQPFAPQGTAMPPQAPVYQQPVQQAQPQQPLFDDDIPF